MRKPKVAVLHVRCSEAELAFYKKAADELDRSLSDFVRSWLNWAVERNARGELLRR